MRWKEFRIYLQEMAADAFDQLKFVIADKIKVLPADDVTIKTLREIEDLLRDVNAGGRKGLIMRDLTSINDPAVNAAQKELARYILSIDGTPEERNELFSLWREDKVINKDLLFSGNHVSFGEVFNTYDTNPITKELVDTLMTNHGYGHGKGEFALSVFSKEINKPKDNKGDLVVDWNGKRMQVEVKTASESVNIDPETGKSKSSTASARFGDQEVKPIAGWDPEARDLNDYVRATGEYKNRKGFRFNSLSGSGLNLSQVIEFYQQTSGQEQTEFINKVKSVIFKIFGNQTNRKEYSARLKSNLKNIITAIEEGDLNAAKQAYAVASFNNYMALKEDDGVLFVDLINSSFIWYNNAEELVAQGLRLHADSIYITGVNDPGRTAYPQIYVQPTTFGREGATKELGKFYKNKKSLEKEDFDHHLARWVLSFAKRRNVSDQRTINKMIELTLKLIINKNVAIKEIIPELERAIPKLQRPKARSLGASTRIPGTVSSTQPAPAMAQVPNPNIPQPPQGAVQ